MFKNISIAILILLLSSCAVPKSEVYLFSYFTGRGEDGLHLAYSNDGLNWQTINNGGSILEPNVGKDKLMRDPCIIQGPDGRYHMVWTTGWWDQHIGYAWSEDLINWSEQKTIPVMEHEPEARNSWAPEVFYDEENELFHIFWATTIPGRHSPIEYTEREKDLNHRMYVTSTKYFETFEPTRMFFNPDFSVIDASIIKHDNEYVMFIKNENPNPPEKNIRITKSDNADGPYPTGVSDPITGDYWAEGPTPLKVGEFIYVYFDKYREHVYGAVRSKDLKNWEDVSDSLNMVSGARHGTMFKVDEEVLNKLLEYFN